LNTEVPTLTLLLLVAGLAGCSTPPPKVASGPEPSTQLAATLVSPTDITLEWKGHEPDAAGRIVEFATEPHGKYTILQFLPPHQTTFTHPNLMPETPFYYRLRPFYGSASPSVQIALPEGPLNEKAQKDDHEWASPRTVPGAPVMKQPIRNVSTAGAAAPTDLKATVMHANGIKFTWTDHASDEEGYLLEVKPEGSSDFGAAAVLDPDINSFGLITLPNEKKASFRVRAFYYGKSSNVAHQMTGAEPSHN
jgi:hypothetical protein